MSKTILVVGGTGYIGSHIVLELVLKNYRVIVLDNLSNSYLEPLERIAQLAFGKKLDDPKTQENLVFYKTDVSNYEDLHSKFQIFGKEIYGVIQLAALKSVSDSFTYALRYYSNNVGGSINLFRCMEEYNIKNIIFSSTASVYGNPKVIPILETAPSEPISVYGETKVACENLLHNLARSNKWSVIVLRYFNPYGAHESGMLGEHQKSNTVPNLIEIMTQAAFGQREHITIYGNSHDTPDGTPIRDFIHIVDLAKGHLAAIKLFDTHEEHIFNLGTGVGTTVLQAINGFCSVVNKEIKINYADARVGDPPILIANCDKANQILNWKAELDFTQMCRDYWKWCQMNPNGYSDTKQS